jgi:hypothetical protein
MIYSTGKSLDHPFKKRLFHSIVNPAKKLVAVASRWTLLDNCRQRQKAPLPSALPSKQFPES